MLEVHILGTSSARPAHGRSVSGTIVRHEGTTVAIDCGEGFQNRVVEHSRDLKDSGRNERTRLGKLNCILLTHGHLDHTWGLLPMLHTMALDNRHAALNVVAPTSHATINRLLDSNNPFDSFEGFEFDSAELVRLFQQWWSLGGTSSTLGFSVDWHLVGVDSQGGVENPTFSAVRLDPDLGNVTPLSSLDGLCGNLEVRFVPTRHSVPSCGWWLKESDKPGKFDRPAAEIAGLNEAQIVRLAQGEDVIHEGERLKSSTFRGDSRNGASVLISGDTSGGVASFGHLSNSGVTTTVLIHEATYLDAHQDRANQYLHSTAKEAAAAALACNAQHLVLTHYSSRIADSSTSRDEASEVHPSVIDATDRDVLHVSSESTVMMRRSPKSWQEIPL